MNALQLTKGITKLTKRIGNESGQALVEYALILFLVALVCVAILGTLGEAVRDALSSIVAGL